MAIASVEILIPAGLSPFNQVVKRGFDVLAAVTGLCLVWWIIVLAYVAAAIDTGQGGFFLQERVGRNGRLFRIIKIRTMRDTPLLPTTVTCAGDPRVTALGRFFRRSRIDELPQLINVLRGQMSIVGPRPDVPGFADQLSGADRIILSVRPGLTGPATLQFRHEALILAAQSDPEAYNRQVIFPQKVKVNRAYVETYSFWTDLEVIVRTVWCRGDWRLEIGD